MVPWCRGAVVPWCRGEKKCNRLKPFCFFPINHKKQKTMNLSFNDEFRRRTKANALEVIKLEARMRSHDALRIIGRQLVRSSCSVAANFRASCRARSHQEHFSKLCIVVEECDETLFWLEILEESGLMTKEILYPIKEETLKILQVLSKARKTLKS